MRSARQAGLRVLLAGAALLCGCPHGPEHSGQPPRQTAYPTRSCKDAWAALPGGAADYDFAYDSDPTPDGNLGYAGYAARVDRRHCHKEWTVLLYMEADNDLTPYAYLDLYEMEAGSAPGAGAEQGAASTSDTDVLVRLDTPAPSAPRRLHMFQTDVPYDATLTRDFFARQTPSFLRSPVVERTPATQPWDQAADLRSFLSWGVTEYPAEHYLVAVWGHGEGWGLPQDPPPAVSPAVPLAAASAQLDPFPTLTGGIAFDYGRRAYLGIPTLHQVLRQVVAGPLGGRAFDIYLSDACLMQSLEVTTDLSDVARFIGGSTQVVDYLGMSYRDLMRGIHAGPPLPAGCAGQPEQAACSVAALIPKVYQDSLQQGLRARLSAQAGQHFTLSAVRSSALGGDLLPALARLGRALSDFLAADPLHSGELQDVLSDPLTPSFLGNDRDVAVFLDLLDRMRARHAVGSAGAGLMQAVAGVRGALSRAEVAHAAGTDYADWPDFAAYSLWLPLSAQDYQRRRASFVSSVFFQYGQHGQVSGPWLAWLDRLYAGPAR